MQEAVERPPAHKLPLALPGQSGQILQDRFRAVVIERALAHQRQRVLHLADAAFAVHGSPSEPHGPVAGAEHAIRYDLVLGAPGDLRRRAVCLARHLRARLYRRRRRPAARAHELAALRRERVLRIPRMRSGARGAP